MRIIILGVVHYGNAHSISEYLNDGSESEVLSGLASELERHSDKDVWNVNLPKGVLPMA
jgi:3-oxoacyl-(acyl-carrier-protein) synthase